VVAVSFLSDECETTRTEIIEEILTYVMDKDELIDEIFGEAEEEESEEEDEEEEE
jgi:hypothetical protein